MSVLLPCDNLHCSHELSHTFSLVLETPHAIPLIIPISPTGTMHSPPTRAPALCASTTRNQLASRDFLTNARAGGRMSLT